MHQSVNVCCRTAKIMNKNHYRILHCQENGTTHDILLLDLDHFQDKSLAFYLINKHLINGERYSRHYYCYQLGSHVFAIVNVVPLDLDLHFQGYKIWNVNISKTMRASKKCSFMTFIEVDVPNQMGPLQTANVLHYDLDLHFQNNKFQSFISQKWWELIRKLVVWHS